MEKRRFEWRQILRAGRIALGPLVLFIAIAIPLSPAHTTLAAEDGAIEVSNQVATSLQVVLVVIVCMLILSVTVYISMSLMHKKASTRPAPDVVNLDHGGGKQTHEEQTQDTEEIPIPVFTSTPNPHTENLKTPTNGTGKRSPRTPDSRIDKIEAAARKYMRVYCTIHRVGFSVSRSGRDIRCNHDHLVASNFPGADWVFCCDCRRFSLASNSEESGSKACPCCERRMVRMYLCDQCQVLSVQSRTSLLPDHMIKDDGIWPSCPSCISRPPEELWNHQCAVVEAELMSVFQPCQWCEQSPPGE